MANVHNAMGNILLLGCRSPWG